MKFVKLLLRLAISASFLSAVADRFGIWKTDVAWGNWQAFVDYTEILNPWIPQSLIPTAAIIATALEIIFPIFLLIGWKTELFAKLSGALLLIFGISMAFSIGIKPPLDYSVFSAAAAAFALGTMKKVKFLELDTYLSKGKRRFDKY